MSTLFSGVRVNSITSRLHKCDGQMDGSNGNIPIISQTSRGINFRLFFLKKKKKGKKESSDGINEIKLVHFFCNTKTIFV